MEYDIRQYERLGEGHPEKTYEHLKSRVHLVIRMQEQKKSMHEREALLSAKPLKGKDVSGTTVPAAPGVEQSGKGTKANKKTEGKASNAATASVGGASAIVGGTAAVKAKSKGKEGKGGKSDKGKGSGSPQSNSKEETNPQTVSTFPCFFFHRTKCEKGASCSYSHAPSTDNQKEALQPPVKRDRSTTPKGKAERRSNSKGRKMYCFSFYKSGICSREGCPWAHLTPEQVTAQGLDKNNSDNAKVPPSSSTSAVALPCI